MTVLFCLVCKIDAGPAGGLRDIRMETRDLQSALFDWLNAFKKGSEERFFAFLARLNGIFL